MMAMAFLLGFQRLPWRACAEWWQTSVDERMLQRIPRHRVVLERYESSIRIS